MTFSTTKNYTERLKNHKKIHTTKTRQKHSNPLHKTDNESKNHQKKCIHTHFSIDELQPCYATDRRMCTRETNEKMRVII